MGLVSRQITTAEFTSLRRILNANDWALHLAPAFPDTKAALRGSSFGVVISVGCCAGGHGWKDVLHEIQGIPTPPQLIVADRLADEALWAEVLNLGCYDLLVMPFATDEVLRVVPMAWNFWEREQERAVAHPKPSKPARLGSQHSRMPLAAGADSQ